MLIIFQHDTKNHDDLTQREPPDSCRTALTSMTSVSLYASVCFSALPFCAFSILVFTSPIICFQL